jgi:MerR family transcriptional regulator, repressor of the yfmOP operon
VSPSVPLPAAAIPPELEGLQKIQEVAAELGLTTRAIRYYEELGLLKPAARSMGAYRLFDADDVERLRFIKGLRDDAGFSLTEIGRLLEDEAARARNRDRFRTTTDPAERRAIVDDALDRVDRQIESLRAKMERLAGMIDEAEGRRDHLRTHLAELDAGREPAPHVHTRSGARPASEIGPSPRLPAR